MWPKLEPDDLIAKMVSSFAIAVVTISSDDIIADKIASIERPGDEKVSFLK